MMIALLAVVGFVEPPPPVFDRLTNGVRLVLVEDHRLPLVSVQVWYGCGGGEADLRQPALRVLAGHVLARRMELPEAPRAGLLPVVEHCPDAFAWSCDIVPDDLPALFRTAAQGMTPRAPSVEEFEAAAAASRPEAEPRREEQQRGTDDAARRALFPEHPYRAAPARLTTRDVADLTRDDLAAYLDNWFIPASATVFVIGAVDAERVRGLAREHLGDLPWRETVQGVPPPRPAPGQKLLPPIAGTRAGVTLALALPEARAVDPAALDVLLQTLGNPVDGLLNQPAGESAALSWHAALWRQAGLLVITWDELDRVSPPQPDAAALVTQFTQSLELIAGQPPDPVAFERARRLAAAARRLEASCFGPRARGWAYAEFVAGRLEAARESASRRASVPVSAVQQAARLLLAAPCVVQPRTVDAAPQPDPWDAELLFGLAPAAAGEPSAVEEAAIARVRRTVEADGPGLRVRVESWPGDLVEAAFQPALPEGATRAGAATELRRMLRDGTRGRDSAGRRDCLTYHGLALDLVNAPDGVRLRVRGAPELLPQMVELLLEFLPAPAGGLGARSDGVAALLRIRGAAEPAAALEAVRAARPGAPITARPAEAERPEPPR